MKLNYWCAALPAVVLGFSLSAFAANLAPDCPDPAPTSPKKVVVGFCGWGVYYTEYDLIKGMLGSAENDSDIDFHYYDWSDVSGTEITDAVKCIHELATIPYKMKDGSTVYSSVIVLGHSHGGTSVHDLSAALETLGVAVNLAVTADPRDPNGGFAMVPTWKAPSNVARWMNYYQQTDWLIPGYPVTGAVNHQITGDHADSPANPLLLTNTGHEVKALAGWRSSPGAK